MTRFDAVGVGVSCLDELLLLPRFPDPRVESGVRVKAYSRQGGGMAATAMAAAGRLGLRTALVSVVGDDDRGREILAGLRAAGVDTSAIAIRPGRRSPLSVVCVHEPTGSRSFLADHDEEVHLRPEDLDRSFITSAPLVLLDSFTPAALTAGRWARQARRAVVYDAGAVPGERAALDEALSWTDCFIASAGFARGFAGADDPAAGAEAIRAAGAGVGVVTAGADGAYVSADEGSFHQPALPVDVVDTTGAGDVFHGAFLVGLAEGWPLRRGVAFAAAAAALSCRALGGRAGLPTRAEVEALLGAGR
jgi:ribokinase